jgi:hypothetical protein
MDISVSGQSGEYHHGRVGDRGAGAYIAVTLINTVQKAVDTGLCRTETNTGRCFCYGISLDIRNLDVVLTPRPVNTESRYNQHKNGQRHESFTPHNFFPGRRCWLHYRILPGTDLS